MKVKELLSDESKWTQGTAGRDADGKGANHLHPECASWCILGAVSRCYGIDKDYERIRDQIAEALKVDSIPEWNDDKRRRFEEVKALVEKLDI